MKKINLFFVQTLMVLSLIFAVGCNKNNDDNGDNGGKTVPDPQGTVLVSMRNANNGTTGVYPDGYDPSDFFYIDGGDNFVSGNYRWVFANVGKVNGLGDVKAISTSGWAQQVAVIPGYGYVGKHYPNNYIRIYVVDYIESTSGGIIGAIVKYQSPFEP